MSARVAFLAALCCCVGVWSSRADPCTELVLFDFSSVRGEPPSEAPLHHGPPASNSSCGGRPRQVLCSDGDFPDDFLCDFGDLGSHPGWRNLSATLRISLRYKESDSICTVILLRKDSSAKFSYNSAECYPEVSHDTIPPFRVADIQGMEVRLDKNECFREEFILVPVPEAGVPGEVRFGLDKYVCQKNPDFGALGIGRTDPPTRFMHDGRRFRPQPDA